MQVQSNQIGDIVLDVMEIIVMVEVI